MNSYPFPSNPSSIFPAFDSEAVASNYKQALVEAFCCDSVSSATVAALFRSAPMLRRA
jgi:hypothetical protein